jgi:hypothetical protein
MESTMSLPQLANTAHERWWSSRRAYAAAAMLSALALELLPFESVLLVVAAADGISVAGVAVPFWYAALTLALGWSFGSGLRRNGAVRALALSGPAIFLVWLWLVRISPTGYGAVQGGPFDGAWLAALFGDLANGAQNLARLCGLLALAVYLWYRGILVGVQPPSLDDVLRRFKIGMVVIIGCAALLVSAPAAVRPPAVGAFTLLLPAEVFCGLVASALARLALQQPGGARATRRQPWLSGAVLLAGGIVGVALLFGLIFNAGSLSALLTHLGPVGVALDAAARWLTNGIAQLLGLLFDAPVRALKALGAHSRLSAPNPPSTARCTSANCAQPGGPPPAVLIVGAVLFYALILAFIIVLCVYLYRLVSRWITHRPRLAPDDMAEERESLDGRALFRRQLRDLFARRRRLRPIPAAEERLEPGSVRALYRDVLRAAARRGLPRLAAETPDEYAVRLAAAGPLAGDPAATAPSDLTALSDAYDDARYGEREADAPTRATLRERARRVIARLTSRQR